MFTLSTKVKIFHHLQVLISQLQIRRRQEYKFHGNTLVGNRNRFRSQSDDVMEMSFVPFLSNRLRFTVVSEPPEDRQDLECEDVGYSYVDLRKIFEGRLDMVDHDVDSKYR